MITEEEGKASEDDDESCNGTTCDEEDSKGGVSPMAASSKSTASIEENITCSADSTLDWLFSLLALLAAMLWHDALATAKGRQTLYHFVAGFAYIIYALHLPPHMYGMESSPLPTPMTGDLTGKFWEEF